MSYARTRETVLSLLPKQGVGAEIGVWKGDFSARILAVAQPRMLHLIDPWQARTDASHAAAWYSAARGTDMDAVYEGVAERFATEITDRRMNLHRASSVDAMATLPDDCLDFIYVDGDHAYEAVREDLALARLKVRPGGLICIDDHMDGKWWGDGVIRATNEFLGAHPRGLEVIFAVNTQVVIRKR